MKFGIQNGLNVARLGLTEDQILTACSLADKTGYNSVWYMDHSNVPQWSNAVVNDPWVMLAGIAAVTNNVELGTCVTDALRRHPSNIALASITLDRLSKGRGTLGIGAGEAQNLKEFNIPFDKPVSKFEEQLQVIKHLYDSDPDNRKTWEGKYYQLTEACLQAKSVRQPHVPIYMASGGKRTLAMTGKYGDGWLPIGYTPELFEDHKDQTCGRAARNAEGKVIMYANNATRSMKAAISETERRRQKQIEYNKTHKIIPKTIIKSIPEQEIELDEIKNKSKTDLGKQKIEVEMQMKVFAEELDFENAIKCRDKIKRIEKELQKNESE